MRHLAGGSRSRLGLVSLVGVLTVLLTFLFAACVGEREVPGQQAGESVPGEEQGNIAKVGVMVPLTGAFAADAKDVVDAATLAVGDINAQGGAAGYKLQVVPADTVNQRADAVRSAFERLKNEPNLNFIMTAYASTSNFEIELMARENMPYLISANAAQTRGIISKNPDQYPTVWSRVPSYDAYETELPRRIEAWAKEGKIQLDNGRTVFIVSSDDPYGSTIAKGLEDNFTELGWTVTGFETVPFASVTDWRAILQKIHSDPPDLIAVTDSAPPNNAAFTNQFRENPTDSLLFLQYGPSVPEFIELTGENSTGVIYNNLGAGIDTLESTQKIREKFEEEYGRPGGYFSVVAYNQVELYAHCLEEVGDPSKRLAIGKCFSQLDIMTPSGRLKFDPKTHLAIQGEDFYPILFYQIREGERFIVWPERYANGEFQPPPWMEE